MEDFIDYLTLLLRFNLIPISHKSNPTWFLIPYLPVHFTRSPTDSELMEEQLDKINRLGEEIGVEFVSVDEWGYISQRLFKIMFVWYNFFWRIVALIIEEC